MGQEVNNRGLIEMSIKIGMFGVLFTMMVGMFNLYGEGVKVKDQNKLNTQNIKELKKELKNLEEKKASKEEMERMFREYQEKIVARIEYSDKITDIKLQSILKTLERIEDKQEKEDKEKEDDK